MGDDTSGRPVEISAETSRESKRRRIADDDEDQRSDDLVAHGQLALTPKHRKRVHHLGFMSDRALNERESSPRKRRFLDSDLGSSTADGELTPIDPRYVIGLYERVSGDELLGLPLELFICHDRGQAEAQAISRLPSERHEILRCSPADSQTEDVRWPEHVVTVIRCSRMIAIISLASLVSPLKVPPV